MNPKRAYRWRRVVDHLARGLCLIAMVMAIVPLGLVLGYVAERGFGGIRLTLFTELPKPVGETGGGIAHAIVGTIELVGIAILIGIPPGLLAGLYLSEYRDRRLATVVRFAADVMSSVPSITVGLFVYALLVVPMGHFSAWAGGTALALLMIPTVARTTEEMCRLVPEALREAALGIGVSRYRTILLVVFRTALPGIVTGLMLSVARVAGETAPLLFTALGNRFWADSPNQPTASLPVQIYAYASSPYEEWHHQAWTGALVLVALVLLVNGAARFLLSRCRRPQ